MREPTHEEIASLAFFLFEERGRKHGHDVEDWLAAEAHLCTDEKHAPKSSNKVRHAGNQRGMAMGV